MSYGQTAEAVGGLASLAEKLAAWGYLTSADASQSEIEAAVVHYQQHHIVPLTAESWRIHGRPAVADGQIGLVTAALMNERHCMVSDFANAEEARWPDACVMAIMISWNFNQFPGLSPEDTRRAWESLSQYEQLFEMACPRKPEEYPNTRVYAALQALPGSVLAWSNLATNNCSFRAQQAYDSTINWSLKLAIGTVRHEVGHAFGMNHTPSDPDSVMYPSMRGQTELNQTDIAQMVRLGYKRRTDPPVPPPPPPGPHRLVHRGSVESFIGSQSYGKFILIPMPEV